MGRTVRKVKHPVGNGNDTAVQGTNDSSIVSKCSMVDAGYFKDDFVNHFVNKRSRRSPLINRGYYVRAAAMEHVFQGFFGAFQHKKKQVVSLGAGFDSAYFRLKSQGLLKVTTYFEVDFPDVMQRKKALIQTSAALREVTEATESSQDIILDCTDYKLLGVDLTRLDLLGQCLTAANIDQSVPTLILSEVVLTYLDAQGSSSVIQWMAAYFESAVFVSYEQVSPDDSFGIVMMNHFNKLRSPLRTIDTFPSGDSQVQRYTRLGWSSAVAVDMNYFYTSALTSAERQRVESLEPFDEFEEWHLKCSHYIVLTAFRGSCVTLRDSLWSHLMSDAKTTGRVFIQDNSGHLYDSSPVTTAGDCGVCVGCGVVTPQSHTQRTHCSGCDSTLGRLTDSAVACRRTNAAVTHAKDVVRNDVLSDSTSIRSEVRKGAMEWTCLPPVEGAQRFGHDSAVIGSHYVVTVGGFGADAGRHCRMRTLLVHQVLNGTVVDIEVIGEHGCDVGNLFECMYHTLTPVGSTSLLLFGGRLSPTRPRLQSFLLEFLLEENQNSDTGNGTERVLSMHGDATTLGTGNVAEIGRLTGPEHCSTPNSDQNIFRMKCVCHKLPTDGTCPSPRWRHSAVSISIDDSPHVVVFGGMSDNHTAFNDCYVLDVQQRCWSKLECKGEIPGPRHSHTASLWNGSMVVACGLAPDLRPLNSVFQLDVVSRTWTEVTVLGNSLRPRYSHAATLVGDRLALVGGVCLTLPPPGVAVVNLVTGVHQEYVLPQQDPSSPIMLHGHSVISAIPVLTERQIVVVGGGGNCFSFGTHLNGMPMLLTLPDESRDTQHCGV